MLSIKPIVLFGPLDLFHESRVAQALPTPFDSLGRHFPWRRFVIARQRRVGAFVPTAVEGNLEIQHDIGITLQQRNGDPRQALFERKGIDLVLPRSPTADRDDVIKRAKAVEFVGWDFHDRRTIAEQINFDKPRLIRGLFPIVRSKRDISALANTIQNCPLTHLRERHRIAPNMLSSVRFYFAYYFNGLRSVAAGCA